MKHLLPGAWVRILWDGEYLRKGDVAVIFTIEKGVSPFLFGAYCLEKDMYEFFERTQLK